MSPKKDPPCPVFPDRICPQGHEMSHECSVRINGDYDPMLYFRDHLLLHCAIYQNQRQTLKTVKEKK